MKWIATLLVPQLFLAVAAFAQDQGAPRSDVYQKGNDQVQLTFYGHASIQLTYQGKQIYFDPIGKYFAAVPKPQPADVIVLTHEHGDHFDPAMIRTLSKPSTLFVANRSYDGVSLETVVFQNGETKTVDGITIQAVPAYNTSAEKLAFHPRGRDNGYVLQLGGIRAYVAGDTEDIPEMANLKDIDIAFLPVNLPYTMTIDQIVHAANLVKPRILYPYHMGNTDLVQLEKELKAKTSAEIRMRSLQ